MYFMSKRNFPHKKLIFFEVIIFEFIIIALLIFITEGNISNPYKIQKVTGDYLLEEQKNNSDICKYFYSLKIGNKSRRDFCYYTKEKPENVIRIMALGDSFVKCSYLPLNETWPKLLEKKLTTIQNNYSYQVLNFGIAGLGAKEKVDLLFDDGIDYNPDIIIFHYLCDDLNPSEITLNMSETEYKNWIKTSNYTLLFQNEAEPNLKRLAEITRKNNIKVIVLFDPSWIIFQCDYQEKMVEQISKENNWGFLDLSPILEKYDEKDLLNASETYHPTTFGNQIRADAIFGYLSSNKYLNY